MTDEKIVFQGKIIEVVQKIVKKGDKELFFEYARRSPGTRLIILTPDNGILLTKEFRNELSDYDYRLPGGKVFDTLEEYNKFIDSGQNIVEKATEAAKKEAREEVGVDIQEITHFATSKCGATVMWDLLYFVVKKYNELGRQELEHGENIEITKVSTDEARELCLNGQMQEDRSVGILLRFLNQHK